MERLTTRTDICCEPENDIVYYNPKDPDGLYNIIDLAKCVHEVDGEEANILLEISNRLAAYEDIEKSPEEIISSLEDYKDISQQYANFVHEMQPLKEAKAEGRLVGCGIWERMINPFGELEGFMCECGHQSLAATNYCSNCGRKMHGGEAAEKALSPICNTTKLPCAECNPVCEHRAKS